MSYKHTGKGNIVKIVSIAAACAVMGASISVLTYAATKNNSDKVGTSTDDTESKTDTVDTKVSKDETVYVLANADGSVKKIIVSDWIKNSLDAKSISDKTELKDVQNVKGNESYTMNGENMRVWDADGNDIYTQGTIDKSLPVDLSVSYKLDGQLVSADKLAGKSGKVTVRFDYKNNQFENVTIDGKQEKIYVPFVMLTGMLLDNDTFKNVTVTNGKVINDGSHIAVVGFAIPGLQDNLGITKDKLDIPDFVEVTADVKNFKLTTTMTLATNNVFNEVDTAKLDSAEDLKNQLGALTSAMTQLLDGSSQLYTNLNILLGKSNELIAGINQLSDGAKKISAGTSSLNEGLKELVSNNDNLNGGAAKVYNTLLGTVQSQIEANGITIDKLTIENYKTVLNNLITNQTDEQTAQIAKLAEAKVNEQLKAAGVPEASYDIVKVMLADRMLKGMTTDAAMAEISPILTNALTVEGIVSSGSFTANAATVKYLCNTYLLDEKSAGIVSIVSQYLAYKSGSTNANDFISAAIPLAKDAGIAENAKTDSAKTVKINKLCATFAMPTLKPTIDSALTQLASFDEFYQGVLAYTAGAQQAYEGSTALNSGAAELNDGMGQLKEKSGALPAGVQQLTDGSKQLADGLKQFNEQGVSKLTNLVGGELGGVITRLKATIDVSKNYKSFAGIVDDADGNVKFIYKTDEIK